MRRIVPGSMSGSITAGRWALEFLASAGVRAWIGAQFRFETAVRTGYGGGRQSGRAVPCEGEGVLVRGHSRKTGGWVGGQAAVGWLLVGWVPRARVGAADGVVR